MRTFSKKKKLPRLLTLCGAVAVSALLGGCGQSGVPAESFIPANSRRLPYLPSSWPTHREQS